MHARTAGPREWEHSRKKATTFPRLPKFMSWQLSLFRKFAGNTCAFGLECLCFHTCESNNFFPLSSWGVAPSSWGRTRTKGVGNNLLGGLSGESRCRSSMFDKIDLFNSFWVCFPVYLSMISQEQTGKFSVDRFPPPAHTGLIRAQKIDAGNGWAAQQRGEFPLADTTGIHGNVACRGWMIKRRFNIVDEQSESLLYFFSRFSRSSHLFSSNSPVLPGTLPVLC